MRFMMLMIPRVYQPDTPAGERAEEGFAPPAEEVNKMMEYNESLAKAGALVSLDGLHPSSQGARVSFVGRKPKVTNGPFADAGDVIGGYWIIEAKSMEEAIGWAIRCPASEGDIIEIRRVFEVSEMPDDVRKISESDVVGEQIEKQEN